jgi:hypothetical protein
VFRCVEPSTIRWFSSFDNPFIHTSVIFRADLVRALGGFNAAYDPFSQDYDLWCRLIENHAVANLPEALVRYRVSDTSIIGTLDSDGGQSDYQRKFDGIVRELTVRQARRLFGADAIDAADAPLIASLVLGLDRTDLATFLALFERLLRRFCDRAWDCSSADFRRTLARQFEALAVRVKPATRSAVLQIYRHVLGHHPELAASVSWTRTIAALLLGGAGRDRFARWKRRQLSIARGKG